MSSDPSIVERARPGRLPQPLTAICAALFVVGTGAFLYGLTTNPQVAWLSFHTNFIYLAMLSQGALILCCAFVIVGARWPGPLRRIAEGLAAWIPVSLVLGCVGYFGGEYLFEWLREGAVHGKEPWLNATRFYATDLGILAVMTVLSLAFLKTSIRPTLGGGGSDGMNGFAKSLASLAGSPALPGVRPLPGSPALPGVWPLLLLQRHLLGNDHLPHMLHYIICYV